MEQREYIPIYNQGSVSFNLISDIQLKIQTIVRIQPRKVIKQVKF